MKIKCNWKILAKFLSTSLLFLATNLGLALGIKPTNLTYNSQQKLLAQQADTNRVLNFDNFPHVQTAITNLGPILHKNNTFFLLDWFGNTIWSTDISKPLVEKGFARENGINSSHTGKINLPNSYWANYVYDQKSQKIFILTWASATNYNCSGCKQFNTGPRNFQFQYIISIDAVTGKLNLDAPEKTPRIDLAPSISFPRYLNLLAQFNNFSIISNGNIAIYGLKGTSGISNGGNGLYIFNPITNKIVLDDRLYHFDTSNAYYSAVNGIRLYGANPLNIIPISPTRSLFLTIQKNEVLYPSKYGIGSVYSTLMDSNFKLANEINYENGLIYKVIKNNKEKNYGWAFKNDLESIYNYGFNINYYKNPITNEIQIPIYDKMYFVKADPSVDVGYSFKTMELPKIKNLTLPYESGIFYSGYFDLKGDLYFNMATWNEATKKWIIAPIIYKLTSSNGDHHISPFVDLSGSSNLDIINNIDRFKIFSIPNQIGKIMLINIDTGIAVAVGESKTNFGTGQIYGTLNGNHSFLKNPDFDLNLGSRYTLPSQLVSNNFQSNGNGIINQLELSNVDDTNGSLTVKATISYLPWFVSQSNTNITTTTVTKKITGLATNRTLKLNKELNYQLKAVTTDFIDNNTLKHFNLFDLVNNNLSDKTTIADYKILSVNKEAGTFDVKADINYRSRTSAQPNEFNYSLNQNYHVLAGTVDKKDYTIGLINGSSITNNKIKKVESTSILSLSIDQKNVLTNLLPSQINSIDIFILKNQLKGYPLWLLKTTLTPNNDDGTLDVKIEIPDSINQKLGFEKTQKIINTKYFGFKTNKKNSLANFSLEKINNLKILNSQISFELNDLKDTTKANALKTKLPSQIQVDDLWNDFLSVKNFNPNTDLDIDLQPDNINGNLSVIIQKKLNNSNLNNLNLFETNNILFISISGFSKLNNKTFNLNLISFVPNNSKQLIKIQKKQANQITINDLNKVVIIGSKLKTILGNNFKLNESNTTLTAQNNIGQLAIKIDLTNELKDKKETLEINQLKTNLPKIFGHTYTGFLINTSNNYIFQAKQKYQLDNKINIKNLTSKEIFDNQDEYILVKKGYILKNANQIQVEYSEYLKSIFIFYNFKNNNLPNDVIHYFSVVYRN